MPQKPKDSSDLAEEHLQWIDYCRDHGAQFEALKPSRLPDKGMGIVATRDIKAGEVIAHIPTKLLFTTNNIPSTLRKLYPKLSVHGLLATALAREYANDQSPRQMWIKTWPSMDDLKSSVPLLLPSRHRLPISIQGLSANSQTFLLPPSIGESLFNSENKITTQHQSGSAMEKQAAKVEKAITLAAQIDPQSFDEDLYRWMWYMVNTRSFYYEGSLKLKPKSKHDHMCLCPILDYFNHEDHGCNANYDDKGFSITADRTYREEVVISYGAHSNDLLWTDYGFLLKQNEYDSVCIDAWMLDPSTGIADIKTQTLLEDHGYWRNYTLSKNGPCYRTQMAIRTQLLDPADWKKLANGEQSHQSEEQLEHETQTYLNDKILQRCISSAKQAQAGIHALESDIPNAMQAFALERWKQIQTLAEKCKQDNV